MSERYLGLMSGTSLDGVDGVMVDFSQPRPLLTHHVSLGFDEPLRAELLSLNTPGANELHRAALAANALARLYARLVSDLLAQAGLSAADVKAIGAHGQTVRHQPQSFDGCGYSLQLNNPSLLAELTGIAVVADFRSRDIAAGGQGAPLVPAFHAEVFGRPGEVVGVLNLGGISNLTVLDGRATGGQAADILGFDCGPANALMDGWCQRHTGQHFDAQGRWAASGQVVSQLLAQFLGEPFFALPPPKSTGRDLFNARWLDQHLRQFGEAEPLAPQHVQATLAELTAASCAAAVRRYAAEASTLIVCGGGAFNLHLMERIRQRLSSVRLAASDAFGIPAQQVEAAAFAWLARKTVRREPASRRSVTGARHDAILGAIYPG